MTILAKPAVGCIGFDASQKLTYKNAEDLYDYGFRWCARYVPLPGVSSHGDIDGPELAAICMAGLSLSLVQHPRNAPWDPAKHSGASDADNAVMYATAAGYPLGAHIYVDLEGMALDAKAADAKLFAESWAARINAAGYRAAAYCGYQIPLDADALWLLHGINSYWTDAGNRLVSNRGCAVSQHAPELTVCGVKIDRDTLAPDRLGEMPMVAVYEPDGDAVA
jgi:hypothetical protein